MKKYLFNISESSSKEETYMRTHIRKCNWSCDSVLYLEAIIIGIYLYLQLAKYNAITSITFRKKEIQALDIHTEFCQLQLLKKTKVC